MKNKITSIKTFIDKRRHRMTPSSIKRTFLPTSLHRVSAILLGIIIIHKVNYLMATLDTRHRLSNKTGWGGAERAKEAAASRRQQKGAPLITNIIFYLTISHYLITNIKKFTMKIEFTLKIFRRDASVGRQST